MFLLVLVLAFVLLLVLALTQAFVLASYWCWRPAPVCVCNFLALY